MNRDYAVLIPVLNDADMTCVANIPTVVYGKLLPFGHQAAALAAFATIYALTGTSATIRVWAQWTVDGVNFMDCADFYSLTTLAMSRCVPLTDRANFGPMMRINVSLTATTAGTARLSVVGNLSYF